MSEKKRIAGIIVMVIIGLVIILFFAAQSLIPPNETRYENQPLFTLWNCDTNQSHTVNVSVISLNTTQFAASYDILPHHEIHSTVYTVKEPQWVDFFFIVDKKQATLISLSIAPRVTTNFNVCNSQGNTSVSVREFIA